MHCRPLYNQDLTDKEKQKTRFEKQSGSEYFLPEIYLYFCEIIFHFAFLYLGK